MKNMTWILTVSTNFWFAGVGYTQTFTDVSQLLNPALNDFVVWGASAADFNNDGWIDIFVPDTPQNQLLFNADGSNHWLKIRLRGNQSNLLGVGARIEVFAGGLYQVKEISAGDGFVSQSHDLTAHFGLGAAVQVDSILVKWPGHGTDRIYNIPPDQEITVVEGLGVGVSESGGLPDEFALSQNYPNPFNPATTTRFSLPKTTHVSLIIYDLSGRQIRMLLHDTRSGGTNTVVWDGRDSSGLPVSSGIYISRLQAGSLVATGKMILLK